MKKLLIVGAVFLLFSYSCSLFSKSSDQKQEADKNTSVHNSKNSLDWAGTYRGIIPCADCPGIKTEIRLYNDLNYTLLTQYMSKSDSVFAENGSFSWNEAGSQITLNLPGGEQDGRHFFVGENTLIMLDAFGNRIEGSMADNYKLSRPGTDIKINGKFWKLIELGGEEIIHHDPQGKIPHLILTSEERRVAGNTGCNLFNGSYELTEENRISFSPLATTRMFCHEVDYEDDFLNLFDRAKFFKTIDDSLHLLDAENNLLGVFVWDFFRPVPEEFER